MTFALLVQKRYAFLIPEIIVISVSLAFWTSKLITMVEQCVSIYYAPNLDNERDLYISFYAMIVFGVGEVMSGMTMGKIIDVFGKKHSVLFIINFFTIAAVLTLALIKFPTFDALMFG
jgi:hypothetical protein